MVKVIHTKKQVFKSLRDVYDSLNRMNLKIKMAAKTAADYIYSVFAQLKKV